MGTLREDITDIKVGVAQLVEHQNQIDDRLLEGNKKFEAHSEKITRHDSAIIRLEIDGKEKGKKLTEHSKALKWIIMQGVLVLISIVGFLVKIIWEHVVSKKTGIGP